MACIREPLGGGVHGICAFTPVSTSRAKIFPGLEGSICFHRAPPSVTRAAPSSDREAQSDTICRRGGKVFLVADPAPSPTLLLVRSAPLFAPRMSAARLPARTHY